MRLARILPLALAASLVAFGAASAQDDVVRELQRKSQANEKDNGYCAGIAGSLARLDEGQVQAGLNRLLAGPDAEAATMLFSTDGPACLYFEFKPAAMREGKKCRASTEFRCDDGGDCSTDATSICEKSPGVWD